ncbi:MAG TPA: HEPN domain-containing protein [Woeseiaceae bacterium]
MIFQVRALVAAEVLDDFLEQAEHLFAQGFHVPAASLAGAVLEDTLRKLAESKGISVPGKTSIDKLNAELAKAGTYDKLVLKRITAIADVRNNADHRHFDKVKKEDVEDTLKWVRRFAADFLG